MSATATREYHSTGNVCAMLQESHRSVVNAIKALSMVPAMKLNGVAYLDADQVDQLVEFFRRRREARELNGG